MDYADQYGKMHETKGGKYFPGRLRGVRDVVRLIDRCKPQSLLDYGSGKGKQYSVDKVQDRWGGSPVPVCYDLGHAPFRRRPEGKFDGVICCDMLEHVEPADVDAVLADIFGYISNRGEGKESFAYLTISTRPALGKRLPDGRNVHLTVQPPEWWRAKIAPHERPGLVLHAAFDVDDEPGQKRLKRAQKLAGR
jgi:hypothetical protein